MFNQAHMQVVAAANTMNQDDDCAIVGVIEAGHEDCPFSVSVEKVP